jgi:hypothetical protein
MGSVLGERYVKALTCGCPGVTPRHVKHLYKLLFDLCARLSSKDDGDPRFMCSGAAGFAWAHERRAGFRAQIEHKEEGDLCFANGNFERAVQLYTRVCVMVHVCITRMPRECVLLQALNLDPNASVWNAALMCNRYERCWLL